MHQIGKLDRFIENRRKNAAYWKKALHPYKDLLILPREEPETKHVFFGYPITVRAEAPFQREELVSYMEKGGIETRPIMAGNIAEQPVMKQMRYRKVGELPNSNLIMKRSFFFGNHNGIGLVEREYIADRLVGFLASTVKR